MDVDIDTPSPPHLPSPEDTPTLTEIIQLTRSELTAPYTRSPAPNYPNTNTNTTNTDNDKHDEPNTDIEVNNDNPIRECGRAALSLLPHDPEMCRRLAYQHLHDVPYREVKACWRRLYIDAVLWLVLRFVEEEGGKRNGNGEEDGFAIDWVTHVAKELDMGVILTGAPGREALVELWISALRGVLEEGGDLGGGDDGGQEDEGEDERKTDAKILRPPRKKRKLDTTSSASTSTSTSTSTRTKITIPKTFPTALPSLPPLTHLIPTTEAPPLSTFQTQLSNPSTQTPLIIKNAINHWPALDTRPWNNPSYFLAHTLGGRRLVPVEIGKSYTDEGWGQKIMRFGEFLEGYLVGGSEDNSEESGGGGEEGEGRKTGYLAQHDLLTQIPSLRADICIPDYCYCDPAPAPATAPASSPPSQHPPSKLLTPLLNTWLGPAHTISPLHTDPYHNILAQVFGYKYVRLYAPDQTTSLYPRSTSENGIDMSNTSSVDLDEALDAFGETAPWSACHVPDRCGMPRSGASPVEGSGDRDAEAEYKDMVERRRNDFESRFPGFRNAKYVEAVLGPGDCLYLPVGWWHYVRSLTVSCSVSFWFN